MRSNLRVSVLVAGLLLAAPEAQGSVVGPGYQWDAGGWSVVVPVLPGEGFADLVADTDRVAVALMASGLGPTLNAHGVMNWHSYPNGIRLVSFDGSFSEMRPYKGHYCEVIGTPLTSSQFSLTGTLLISEALRARYTGYNGGQYGNACPITTYWQKQNTVLRGTWTALNGAPPPVPVPLPAGAGLLATVVAMLGALSFLPQPPRRRASIRSRRHRQVAI